MKKRQFNFKCIFSDYCYFFSGCGESVSVVTIGSQVWTNKNLDVETYSNGDVIPQVQDKSAWTNLTTGALVL